MKLKLMAMAALAACVAAAMPTKEEIAEANKEVRESLKAQIAAWKDGKLSHACAYKLAQQSKEVQEQIFTACNPDNVSEWHLQEH